MGSLERRRDDLLTARQHRRVGGRGRPRGPCPGYQQCETVQRRGDGIWRGTQQPGQFRRCRFPRHAASNQRRMRRPGGALRPWVERPYQHGQPVRPEELLLRRSALRLSDQPVRTPDRRDRPDRGGTRRRIDQGDRHYPAAPGAGRRQVDPRPAPDQVADRPEPSRCGD